MDLISQIVTTKDNMMFEEIQKDIDKLSLSVQLIKKKMNQELNDLKKYNRRCISQDRYICFFADDLNQLNDSLTSLEPRVENLNEAEKKVEFFVKLREICDSLNYLKNIQKMDNYMRTIDDLRANNILVATHNTIETKNLVSNASKQEEFQIFLNCIMKRSCLNFSSIKVELEMKWQSLITVTVNNKGNTILMSKLNVLLCTVPSLNDVFHCLTELNSPVIQSFSKHFLDDILKPVLLHPCDITQDRTTGFACLTLKYLGKSNDMPIDKVLQNVITIFNFINSNLNLTHNDKLDFIPSLGSYIGDTFISLLTQHHLSNIPIDKIEELQPLCNQLKEVMLDNNFIIKNSHLVNSLEIVKDKNIMTQCINRAMLLIKKDLLNTEKAASMEIIHPTHGLFEPLAITNEHGQSEHIINFNFLNESDILFPECLISKSIGELVVFFENILNGLFIQSSPTITFSQSIYEILCLYLTCPKLHPSSPRHSALIFNNSMFLAVNLSLLHRDNKVMSDYPFSGMVYKLQNLALSELDKVMLSEQNNLSESIRKSGLANSFDLEKFPDNTETIIRGCIKQLQNLASSWADILPSNVYSMAMGHLCCRFMKDIISTVMAARVINSEIKYSLHILFTYILESVENLFKDEAALEKYVENWVKWREFCLLFNANLSTVFTRWDKATGPLSLHFNSSQMQDIITSLFPSSELRDQILATII